MKTLYLYVEDNNLRNMYETAVMEHNAAIAQSAFSDSGFDLFLPRDYSLTEGISKIDYDVKSAMYDSDQPVSRPCAFCIYPRSSIYKSHLRMTNSVGVIDRGYRGILASVFHADSPVDLKRGQRLVQVCSPDLEPFMVELVAEVEGLGLTERGTGGFGSTGV
jgi:dUTP pyrophosphatase